MTRPETDTYDRRTFVAALGTVGAVAVAGCADTDEQPTDDDTAETAGDDEETMTSEEEPTTDDGDTTDDDEEMTDDGENTTGTADGEQYELMIEVMDSEDMPVEGASIDIENDAGEAAAGSPVETDADGQAMVDLADGMYTVTVQADGFADAEETVTIDGAAEELMIQLEADGMETEMDGDENETS